MGEIALQAAETVEEKGWRSSKRRSCDRAWGAVNRGRADT